MKSQVEIAIELDKNNINKYKVEAIYDNKIYIRNSESYLLGLCHLALERATKNKKYLGASISHSIPLKTCHHLL